MIKKISLKKVASYGEKETILETDKKINLVYGLNGSGKTTLSNFLASRSHVDFSNCLLEGSSNEKILVYNYNFVQRNFYDKDKLNGIFTLSSVNKDAAEKIEKAKNEIKKIDLQLSDEENDYEAKQDDLRDIMLVNADKIWEIKTNYTGGDRILEFCLEDYNKKDKMLFFEKFLTLEIPESKIEKNINVIKKEAEATQGIDARKYEDCDHKIRFDFETIENDAIFAEIIVGNEISVIAELIKGLNNSDWVKQGTKFLKKPKEKNEKCPFCQQETVTEALYNQIRDYFDTTYETKIILLEGLEKKYWDAYQNILKEDIFLTDPFIKNKEKDFKLLYKNLTEKLRSNWLKIAEKKKYPSQIFQLESTVKEIELLNAFLDEIIEEIETHNLKIDNKDKTRENIKVAFWQIMRWDYDQIIKDYNIKKKSLESEIRKIKADISKLETDKVYQQNIIRKAQKEIINIDEAVENINKGLRDLGHDSFKIIKLDENFYQIKRDGSMENQFRTLSEGEKTIISFLYFIELCKGKEEKNEVAGNKVVVIDDPISSLSHSYIFNVSQLIKFNFFNKAEFQQVFILTHSLYFFHELVKKVDKRLIKLFRLTKSHNNNSCILEMDRNEIKNDYQSYWQIIQDHENGNASDALLANCMRNILEHFFEFIEREKLDEAIERLDSQKYQAFIRYINRESHSDDENITDMKEINTCLFKDAFREIFEKSGYENHYNKMMNNKIKICPRN